MRDYEGLLRAGNQAQLEKLKENSYKKNWDDMNGWYAIGRMNEEIRELAEAYARRDYREARREAADVANFAHMVVVLCDKMTEAT